MVFCSKCRIKRSRQLQTVEVNRRPAITEQARKIWGKGPNFIIRSKARSLFDSVYRVTAYDNTGKLQMC